MRVLGVDPGMTRCGIGVVDGAPGRPLTLVSVDVIRTPSDAHVGDRLVDHRRCHRCRDRPRIAPDVVAVERVFSQHNVRTVMGTAQAAGLAILAATRAGIPVALHTPSEVKAAVTGSGRAGKAQVGGDGHPAAPSCRNSPGRPTPPTRWRWRSASCGAARRRPGSRRN